VYEFIIIIIIVYHDFLNVLDREKTTQLLSHWSYDHKIELKEKSQFFKSWLYLMLSYKLQKIKEYLEENLKKKFITLSKASFASSILFIKKKDDSLCFCINYWKLNALIKRNRYSIFLIDEVLAWIQDSKYLTWLNIIITFNKLHMSSESEDLTTFVTFFNIYKYKVMLFELINESAFFQHYINDVKLIIKLSFKLTFWIQIEIELNYSYFQLNLSWIAHIFNLTWLNSTENWINLT